MPKKKNKYDNTEMENCERIVTGDSHGTWLMTRYIERVKEFDVVDKKRKKEEN